MPPCSLAAVWFLSRDSLIVLLPSAPVTKMPPRISKDLENNIGETDRQVARGMHVNHHTVARVRRAIMPDMPVSKGRAPRQWSETDVKNINFRSNAEMRKQLLLLPEISASTADIR